MTSEQALTIALRALSYTVGDETLLPRFMALSGLDTAGLRAAAEDPQSLAGVLDFLLANERDLIAFCEANDLAPELPAAAYRCLTGAPME